MIECDWWSFICERVRGKHKVVILSVIFCYFVRHAEVICVFIDD